MKTLQLTLLLLISSITFSFGQACVIDTNNYELFSPPSQELPCVVRNTPYDLTLQLFCPPSLGGINIDSIKVTSFPGMPSGLTKVSFPANGIMYPLTRMCIHISGTTTDTAGYYNILYNGTAYTSSGNAPFSYLRNNVPGVLPDYALTVINMGDACPNTDTVSTGIEKLSVVYKSVFSVYPNPNNGTFQFTFNTEQKLSGQINVLDITGRVILSQRTEPTAFYTTAINLGNSAKGIYLVQYATAEGVFAKKISVE